MAGTEQSHPPSPLVNQIVNGDQSTQVTMNMAGPEQIHLPPENPIANLDQPTEVVINKAGPEQSYPPMANPMANGVKLTEVMMNKAGPEKRYPPLANPITVVSPQFCAPYPLDLTIVRKVLTITDGNFAVTDVNGNVMFKVKGKLLSGRLILLDASGQPVLSLRQKIWSVHRRWEVYRGDSSEAKDLLFSVRKSTLLQIKTKLDVFMATNTEEEACDFNIEGSWLERSCTITAGESKTIIAQMNKKQSFQSVVLGKDTLAVTVHPNVDYAFIVAVVVILDEINA